MRGILMAYPWRTPVKLRKYTAPQGVDSFLDFGGELRKFWCLKREKLLIEQVNITTTNIENKIKISRLNYLGC